mmetsp:Transcript_36751/g.105874  ORF Transcript_36751/g.105874 Transcript_36751/m.105874 type:complete len:266 (-) Transcript_36751:21-818(-)
MTHKIISPASKRMRCLRIVSFHLALVTFFVLCSLLFPLGLFGIREPLELGRNDSGDLSKGSFRILLLDNGASLDGVEEVSTHVSLGSIGILLGLLALAARLLHGNIVGHFLLVAKLVSLSLLGPLLHLLFRKGLVLGRQDTGHIPEAGIRVIGFDLGTVRLGVKEEGTHGTLGLGGVLPFLLSSLSLGGFLFGFLLDFLNFLFNRFVFVRHGGCFVVLVLDQQSFYEGMKHGNKRRALPSVKGLLVLFSRLSTGRRFKNLARELK